ncbi:MAG: ferritin-like domain-containing protein [Flavobacteriaceae bacterium]|nr:ferritin-like domain-containing protein [Flavobacteriaceae bacterium]
MNLNQYCEQILLGGSLEDKLLSIGDINFTNESPFLVPKLPGRSDNLKFSTKQVRFPRGNFHEREKLALALHSFANHELLAIEMMACALLLYPHNTDELKRFKLGVIKSLKDEQKHFKLYVDRLNELGYDFGDFPLNDFFWNQMEKLKTPSQYLAVMSLTFEAANLDFAHFYSHLFKELGDLKTAKILDIVLEDEISHVALGANYLGKWRGQSSLWDYYNESLPYPMSPARSKGKLFVEHVRQQANLDQDFINKVKHYDDQFSITKRKEWKK